MGLSLTVNASLLTLPPVTNVPSAAVSSGSLICGKIGVGFHKPTAISELGGAFCPMGGLLFEALPTARGACGLRFAHRSEDLGRRNASDLADDAHLSAVAFHDFLADHFLCGVRAALHQHVGPTA